ncbi:MAG: hypothetical protein KF819_23460 [Labilithrix sp.]|nr:hypothetical protein [Labilithrix sp.]
MRRAILQRIAVGLTAAAGLGACATLAGLEDPAGSSGGATTGNGSGELTITPADVDFKTIKCGARPTTKIGIVNNTGAIAKWKAQSLDESSFGISSEAEGSVASPGTATIEIDAKTNVARELGSALLITAGNVSQEVRLKGVVEGGAIEFGPSTADLGEVRMQNGGSVEVDVVNRGNRAVDISSFDGQTADFTVSPGSMRLEPNVPKKLTVKLASGTQSALLTAAITPVVPEAHCGEPPALAARGQRINTEVTVANADFGDIDCGANGNRAVVVTNYTSGALSYTAAVAGGSPFTVQPSGTIALGNGAGVTTNIPVQLPAQSTPGLKESDLTVTITGIGPPSGGPRVVKVRANVRGMLITATPTTINDFQSDGGATDTRTFTVRNAGNRDAFLVWSISNGQWTGSAPSFLPGNSALVNAQVSFKATQAGTSTATLSASRSILPPPAATCAPLPVLNLQGTNP